MILFKNTFILSITSKAFTAIILITLLQSCITIRINDDGSREVTNTEAISEFNFSEVGEIQNYKTQESIEFQEVNAEDMVKMKSLSEKTWFYVWGSWCAPCIEKIPKIIEMDKNDENLNIILVSEDYSIGKLQGILFKNGYNKIPYILETERYGRKTGEKSLKLYEDLSPKAEYDGGFPQNYIYNSKTGAQVYMGGSVVESDLEKIGISMN